MSESLAIDNYIKSVYSLRKAAVVSDMFNILSNMDRFNNLKLVLEQFLDTMSQQNIIITDPDVVSSFDNIIINYCIDNVITYDYGVIIDKEETPDINFISGMLEFYNSLYVYNPVTSQDALDIINSDESDNVLLLSKIAAMYQPALYGYDAYRYIDSVSDVVLNRYSAILEGTIKIATNTDHELSELTNKINNIDPILLRTKLYRMIATTGSYNLDMKQLIQYINGLENDLDLTKEYMVIKIILDLTLEEVMNAIEGMYDSIMINNIVSYIRSKE